MIKCSGCPYKFPELPFTLKDGSFKYHSEACRYWDFTHNLKPKKLVSVMAFKMKMIAEEKRKKNEQI